MLGSITPLGERGRGSRWWLTTTAYVVGSVVGGVAMGALAGAIGAAAFSSIGLTARLVVLAAAVGAGLLVDLGVVGVALPTVHRQVDEAWRTRYRGWVWGLGFGLQLGTGVVTIVTTSAVYATWLAAALTGGVKTGAVVGLVFGLSRALPVLTVARVRRPDQLLRVDAVLTRLAEPSRRVACAAGSAVAAVALVGAVRW
ncbi:MAG TPA: sulfite exporter TauE/SafE family protein [Actinomycetota bacterium]|nr:sulfite exporter TauE/SafE family protein [Actinomycetota bacterium]